MNRIVTILVTAMAVTFLAFPAMAKKYEVPKNICWSYDDGGTYYLTVGTSKAGWVRYQDAGKVSFYTVQGLENRDLVNGESVNWSQLSGTANVDGDGILRMTVFSDYIHFYAFDIAWDLKNKEGNVYYSEDAAVDLGPIDLTEVNCRTLSLAP